MSSQPSTRVRVGIIGANPTRGWASTAHLPALAHLPELEVTAVATTREASARETAQAFGIPLAFGDAADLVVHPAVDLVTVAVKVPSHAQLIRAALAAGKHVLSEWPLGVNLDEARELAELANKAGVVHAVGLQGVHAPGARFVRDLIAEGRIGAVQSAAIIASGGRLGGNRLPQLSEWTNDPAAGASVLSITGGHVLATLAEAVGELHQVSAVVTNIHDHITVVETGASLPPRTPSQIGLVGTVSGGAVVSVMLQGGSPPTASGFFLKVVGSDGALVITPAQSGSSLHIDDWAIRIAPADGPVTEMAVPERYRVVPADVPAGPPANVAALYREVARAITEQRQALPSFDTAVRYHQLLATLEEASQTGARQAVGREAGGPTDVARDQRHLTHRAGP